MEDSLGVGKIRQIFSSDILVMPTWWRTERPIGSIILTSRRFVVLMDGGGDMRVTGE